MRVGILRGNHLNYEPTRRIVKGILFVSFLGCFGLSCNPLISSIRHEEKVPLPLVRENHVSDDNDKAEIAELKTDESRESEIENETDEDQEGQSSPRPDLQKKAINWVLAIFAATVLAGIFVRFKQLRKLRGIFLVSSLVILGFMRGPCPCMISSFINMILWLFGTNKPLYLFLWFLGLIPLTYILGRVWCGWVCHLGAFQEFLFSGAKFRVLKSAGAKKTMKILQYFLFATLITQLFITKDNVWCRIDPFLAGFSLFSATKIGLVLLGLTLLSSVIIFRPFCRAACPIGLVLGWVSKIPGASILEDKLECINCSVCSETCQSQAIERKKEGETLSLEFDNRECNVCGDCMSSCDKNAVKFSRTKWNKTKTAAFLRKLFKK